MMRINMRKYKAHLVIAAVLMISCILISTNAEMYSDPLLNRKGYETKGEYKITQQPLHEGYEYAKYRSESKSTRKDNLSNIRNLRNNTTIIPNIGNDTYDSKNSSNVEHQRQKGSKITLRDQPGYTTRPNGNNKEYSRILTNKFSNNIRPYDSSNGKGLGDANSAQRHQYSIREGDNPNTLLINTNIDSDTNKSGGSSDNVRKYSETILPSQDSSGIRVSVLTLSDETSGIRDPKLSNPAVQAVNGDKTLYKGQYESAINRGKGAPSASKFYSDNTTQGVQKEPDQKSRNGHWNTLTNENDINGATPRPSAKNEQRPPEVSNRGQQSHDQGSESVQKLPNPDNVQQLPSPDRRQKLPNIDSGQQQLSENRRKQSSTNDYGQTGSESQPNIYNQELTNKIEDGNNGGNENQDGKSEDVDMSKNIPSSGSMMGRGHDIRDPKYWTKKSLSKSGDSLESCKSLSQRDNLDNPYIYVHNVGRCKEGVKTSLKWNPKLASDSKQYSEGVLDFIQKKLGASASSESGYNNYNRVMSMLNGKNLHAVVPYTQSPSSSSSGAPNFPPTGQSYIMRSADNSIMKLRDLNSAVRRSLNKQQASDIKHTRALQRRADIGSVQYGINQIKRQLPSNIRMENLVNNGRIDPSNPLLSPENANPTLQQGVKALVFLRPEYFGGFKVGTESNVTISSDEIVAADTHLSFYESERKTAQKSFGSDAGLRQSFDSGKMLFSGGQPVGHFFQYLWEDTNYVGCSYSSRVGISFSACLYYPSGNVAGVSAVNSTGTNRKDVNLVGTASNAFFQRNQEFNTSNSNIRSMVSKFLEAKMRGEVS